MRIEIDEEREESNNKKNEDEKSDAKISENTKGIRKQTIKTTPCCFSSIIYSGVECLRSRQSGQTKRKYPRDESSLCIYTLYTITYHLSVLYLPPSLSPHASLYHLDLCMCVC